MHKGKRIFYTNTNPCHNIRIYIYRYVDVCKYICAVRLRHELSQAGGRGRHPPFPRDRLARLGIRPGRAHMQWYSLHECIHTPHGGGPYAPTPDAGRRLGKPLYTTPCMYKAKVEG